MLWLNLFGTPGVTAGNAPLPSRATRGRRLALLALLTCNRGRSLRRDAIMALLSPESSTDRARAQLSDDLYILRSALGDEVVTSSGDEIALNDAAVSSDVALFERLMREEQFESAVELVVGPLLDGFHLSDSPEFERWLDTERTRLAAQHTAALESLAETAETAADFGAASEWWRRLATLDPYCGRVTLRLMRSLDANGDRAGAMRHARVHTALMREELDAVPTPEVLEFAERLRTDPRSSVIPTVFTAQQPTSAADVRKLASPVSSGSDSSEPASAFAPTPEELPPRAARARRSVFRYAAATLPVIVTLAGVQALSKRSPAAPVSAPSIAVLPFVNLSAAPDDAYFSDGLTEQIIATLGRVEGLHVAARTSSFSVRDMAMDARLIADTLGVAHVLEGSVRRNGDRLRITAKMIDAATGYHLWTEEYDRQRADIIDVQSEIAGAIATALRLRLNPLPATAKTPSLQAYDLYLRALYLRNAMKADQLSQALEYFDRAIALEPTFALAYAGKASVLAPAVFFGYKHEEDGVRELRALVNKALALDSTLGEAHTALGIVQLFWDWDWAGAEQSLRRAVALNPNDAHAYHHLANYFNAMAMLDEAISARVRSMELDPLNPRTVTVLAGDYLRRRDYDRAQQLYARAMRLDPVHPILVGLGPGEPAGPGKVFEAQGRYREAVEAYSRIATLRGATTAEVDALREAFARGGMTAFWRRWIDMDQRQVTQPQEPVRASMLWLLAGDTAQSMRWLDLAYEQRSPGLVFLGRGAPSSLDGMDDHPRVARIMTRMKLPRREEVRSRVR